MSIFLPLHITFIIATGLVVLYSDEQGLAWILGKKEKLSAHQLEWLHASVGIGLACIVTTGGLLFLRAPSYYLADPTFIVKMCFVFALIVNGFFVGQFSRVASEKKWSELSSSERLPMLISGAISGASWIGAAICGLLL